MNPLKSQLLTLDIEQAIMNCQKCGEIISANFNFCGSCLQSVKAAPSNLPQQGQVKTDYMGNISVVASNLAEYKLALKELKLMRRDIANQKRRVMEEKRQIRASYTHKVRTPGFFGVSSYDRITLANDLLPLERQQQDLEEKRIKISNSIIEVEMLIMQCR